MTLNLSAGVRAKLAQVARATSRSASYVADVALSRVLDVYLADPNTL